VDDSEIDRFDETFSYDAQGRMTSQRRDGDASNATGGEYAYYARSNRLEKVSIGMGGTADDRHMGADSNFVYDADGNMIRDASKKMSVSYDYRGLPTEFVREVPSSSGIAGEADSVRLVMTYDGSGSRIGKRYERRNEGDTAWALQLATHYTGLGSEIRENGLDGTARVVVSLPQGLGRYGVESASESVANTVPSFEYYLKNHLGSTMLVYGVGASNSVRAAYDYRAFGEEVDLTLPADKVTENFTGKERDDETGLGYWGARYLDQMLGMWVSVDVARQYQNPYLYGGNNPVNRTDPDGNVTIGGQVRVEGTSTPGFGATGGVTLSLMFDIDRFTSGKNPLLYAVSVDGGGKFSTSSGGSVSVGGFINSDSPQLGGYITPRIDMNLFMGLGFGTSVNPSNETSGRYDASFSVGVGAENTIGGGMEVGNIGEFSIMKFLDNRMKNAIETDYSEGGYAD